MKYTWLFISVLYFPAGVGLLYHSAVPSSLTSLGDRLLSLALTLFCIELGKMAIVDLSNLAAVLDNPADPEVETFSLTPFKATVVSTVVLELIGFYTALFLPAYGAAVVIFSQLWFNALVNVQLWPGFSPAVTPFKLQQRVPVLVANAVALILLSLWFISEFQVWLALGLLILITLFLLIKYCLPGAQPRHPSRNPSQPPSK